MPASAYLETGRRFLIMPWPTDPLANWIWKANSKDALSYTDNDGAAESVLSSKNTGPRDEANDSEQPGTTSSGDFSVPQDLRNAVFYLAMMSLCCLLFAIGIQHTTVIGVWIGVVVILFGTTIGIMKYMAGSSIIPARITIGLLSVGLQIAALTSVPHCASYEVLGGRELLLVLMAHTFQVSVSAAKKGWKTPIICMASATTLLFVLAAARCTFASFDALNSVPVKYLVPPSVAVLCQVILPGIAFVASQIRVHAFDASKETNSQGSESFGLSVLKAAVNKDIPLMCKLSIEYDEGAHNAIPSAADDALVEVIRVLGQMSLPTLVTPANDPNDSTRTPRSRRGSVSPSSNGGVEIGMLNNDDRPHSKGSFEVEAFTSNISGLLRRNSQQNLSRRRRTSRIERISSNSHSSSMKGRNSPDHGSISPIPHTPNMSRCPAFITYFSLPRMRAYLNGPLASSDLAQMFTVEFAEAVMTTLPRWNGKLAFSSFDTLVAVFASPVAAVAAATQIQSICKRNSQHHKDPALNVSEGHRPLTFTALADTFVGSPAAGCAMGYSPIERVANAIIDMHRVSAQPVPSNLIATSIVDYIEEEFEVQPSNISVSISIVRNARRLNDDGDPQIDSIDEILLGPEDLPDLPVVEVKSLPPKHPTTSSQSNGATHPSLSTRPISATRGYIQKKPHKDGGGASDEEMSQSASVLHHPLDQNNVPPMDPLDQTKSAFAAMMRTPPKGGKKKQLPPQVLEVWNSIDIDQNGYLEQHELEVLIKKIGLSMTKEEIRRFFRQIDTDGSGTITFDEFEAAFYSSSLGGATVMSSIRRAGVAMSHSNEKEFISMIDKVWRKYDSDGSGRLEEPEIVQILKDIGMSHTPEEVHWLMIKIDKDSNGYIEFDEFIMLFNGDGASEFSLIKERIQSVTRVMSHKNDSTIYSTADQLIRDKKIHVQALVDTWVTPLLFLYIAYVSGSVSFGASVGEKDQVPEPLMYVDIVLDFFYAIWVIAKIFYLPKEFRGSVIFKDIAKHQIRRLEFYIDVISILPLDFIFIGLGSPANGDVIAYYRINKILTVYHLDWCYKLFAESFNPAVSRAMNAFLYFFGFAHIFACALVIITRNVGQGVMVDLANTDKLLDDRDTRYLKSFYWSILTVAGQLTGLTVPPLDSQVALLLCGVLAGLPMYTVVLGTVGNAVTVETSYTRYLDKIDGLRSYFEYTQLPKDFENDIVGYYQHLFQTTNTLDITENPLDDLPIELSIQIIIAMGSDMLKAVPIFKSASTNLEFVHELTSKLVPRVIEPRCTVMLKGEVGTEMYFVTFGNFHVFVEGVGNVFTFSRGNFFGEIALLHSSKRTATIINGDRFGNVLVLDKDPFQEVARFFPDCLSQVYKAAEDRIKQIRDQEKKDKEAADLKRNQSPENSRALKSEGSGEPGKQPPAEVEGHTPTDRGENNSTGGAEGRGDESPSVAFPGSIPGHGNVSDNNEIVTLKSDGSGVARDVEEDATVSDMASSIEAIPEHPDLSAVRLRSIGNAIAVRSDYDHQVQPTTTQLFGTQDEPCNLASSSVNASRPRSPTLLMAPSDFGRHSSSGNASGNASDEFDE